MDSTKNNLFLIGVIILSISTGLVFEWAFHFSNIIWYYIYGVGMVLG